MGRRLNGNTLAVVNGHLRPLRESVAYERDVGVGVPAMVDKLIKIWFSLFNLI
jgi:hypothetical protein